MSVLDFDKNSLGNLEYSLQREMLATNRAGGYMSTTIVCCNTRKYHGLVVCPRNNSDEKNYVLLSSLDETVIQHDQSFNLALHRFPGVYEPRGHKYITDFRYTPNPAITYRVGGVVLLKELLWIHSRTQLLIRYTLLEAHSDTKLRLRPFLAYRDSHSLSSANLFANGASHPIPGGVRSRMYEDLPELFMQVNCKSKFVAAPDWYYGFEYAEEHKRGYESHEDLMTTGYFEMNIKKGESVIFSCSTEEVDADSLDSAYEAELARRSPKVDMLSCLRHAARQFIVRHGTRTEVVAGYPWFGRWGRDTFIALPGLTLTQGGEESCKEVLDTMVSEMKDGLFPNMGTAYNSIDAPMWFFWAVQQADQSFGKKMIWECYGKAMKAIINAFCRGIGDAIKIQPNGLVWASSPGHALTWMDAIAYGRPVTGRDGYQVEVNALWYNAICYTLELAREFKDTHFIKEFKDYPEKIKKAFIETFWLPEGYLADYVDYNERNWFIRPNQIIACSLPYTMLDEVQRLEVIATVKQHLLTPKGLRTLSPRNKLYQGRIEGDQPTRDSQYHQGTVWPWLLEHYAKANFDILGKEFLADAQQIVDNFEEDMNCYGIGSIAEIYDGDPPHNPKGTISQAWSVAAILRINQMIEQYSAK